MFFMRRKAKLTPEFPVGIILNHPSPRRIVAVATFGHRGRQSQRGVRIASNPFPVTQH